jgi:hypothetical protein
MRDVRELPLAWALALVALGCGTSLSAAGQGVKVADEAPPQCKRLGAVTASAQGGHGEEVKVDAATIELRNRIGEMGGDTVVVESQSEEGQLIKLSGTAYQCDSGG